MASRRRQRCGCDGHILPTSLTVSRAAAPGPMLTTLLMVCVVAAVVILPSVGLLYALDQKSLAGEDLT